MAAKHSIALAALLPTLALAPALAACADEGNIRGRLDAIEVADGADVAGDGADSGGLDTSAPGDTTTPDTSPPGDTTSPPQDSTPGDTTTADTSTPGDTTPSDTSTPGDTTPSDTSTTPWELDPDAPWALGRPLAVAGTDGAAEVGGAIIASGAYRALVPVRVGSGSVVADGRTFPAPEAGAHAAVVALRGDLASPSVGTAVYLDGPLQAPERPGIAFCDGMLYATINDAGGQSARIARLDGNLETIDVALLSAVPGIGHTVRLGAPVCGGPGVVTTLDAVGGASFQAPSGAKAEFQPAQTENKTLILNVTRVYAENAAQVVSAPSMRILQLAAGKDKILYYVGEATAQRQIGETTLMPGDQLVYNHDYSVGQGGSIASQAWFGREDIAFLSTAADGRFAVVWVDVTPAANPGDPELIETVLSVFEADGARAWTKRSSGWGIDRVSFDAHGDVRIAGRFRSLEALGIATTPVGLEDAFIAALAGADGARLRFAVIGVAGIESRIVGPIFDGAGSGECADAGVLDAVLVRTGPTRVGIGVGLDRRCATQALTAADGELLLTLMPDDGDDATDFWLTLSGAPLGGSHGASWPATGAHVGPIRGRFVSPL